MSIFLIQLQINIYYFYMINTQIKVKQNAANENNCLQTGFYIQIRFFKNSILFIFTILLKSWSISAVSFLLFAF